MRKPTLSEGANAMAIMNAAGSAVHAGAGNTTGAVILGAVAVAGVVVDRFGDQIVDGVHAVKNLLTGDDDN